MYNAWRMSLLLWCVIVQSTYCAKPDCSPEAVTKFKREIFERLTSLAQTVLDFTNSDPSEKSQIESVLNELALRHEIDKLKASKEFGKPQIKVTNVDVKDVHAPADEDVYVTVEAPLNVITKHVTHDVPESTTETTFPAKTTESREINKDKRTERVCMSLGMECSPRKLLFCCEGLFCKRERLMSIGRCTL